MTGPQKRSAAVIRQLAVDRRIWQDVTEQSARVRQMVDDGALQYGTWPELVNDTFLSLYKPDPLLREANEIEPMYLAHRAIIQTLLEDPGFQTLRVDTVLQDLMAAVSTVALTDQLRAALRDNKPLQAWWHQQHTAARAAHDAPEGSQAQADALALLQSAPTGEAQQALRASMHMAVAAGQAAGEAIAGVFRAWGHEVAELQALSVEARLELAEQLRSTPSLRQIARLVGRLKNLRTGLMAANMQPGHEEVYGIATGAHLDRVLPEELARLAHPRARMLFKARWAEQQLLEYALRGRQPAGLGPMIILLDVSGSTEGHIAVWEKGVALALVGEAQRARRPATIFAFNGSVVGKAIWPKQCAAAEDLRNMQKVAAWSSRGGTNWSRPIAHSLRLLTQETWRAADIVLITDGVARNDEGAPGDLDAPVKDALQGERAKGLRVFTVIVGTDASPLIHTWSDQVIKVAPTDDAAAAVFQMVLKPSMDKKGAWA